MTHNFHVITVPANITTSPEQIEAEISSTVHFNCTAFGIPLPDIFWARDINGVANFIDDFGQEDKYIIRSETDMENRVVISTLEVVGVQESDTGPYSCIASNGVILSNLTSIIDSVSTNLTIQAGI